VNSDASEVAKFALNCRNPDIVTDLRTLNARPRNDAFDQFWAMMAQVVDGRVNDRRHSVVVPVLMLLLHVVVVIHVVVADPIATFVVDVGVAAAVFFIFLRCRKHIVYANCNLCLELD
jgi:hypothetical protein